MKRTHIIHPARVHIHVPTDLGAKVADMVVGGMGSWRFIIIQTLIVALWIAANLVLLSRPFDVYPFILLNLVFSTQAAYASPLILMAANRQSAKDALRDNTEAGEVQELYDINKQQLEILKDQAVLKQQNAEILKGQAEIKNQLAEIQVMLKGKVK